MWSSPELLISWSLKTLQKSKDKYDGGILVFTDGWKNPSLSLLKTIIDISSVNVSGRTTILYSVAFESVWNSESVTFPQRLENKCPLEIWQDKRAPDNTKLKPSIHSFYFADVKQILYFKAFHFSRSNWGSSCIFLYTSMTKQAAHTTFCLWKSQRRTFPSRPPKRSNNRIKKVSVASGAITQCVFIAGSCSLVKRKSCARVFLAWPSINLISFFLPFL